MAAAQVTLLRAAQGLFQVPAAPLVGLCAGRRFFHVAGLRLQGGVHLLQIPRDPAGSFFSSASQASCLWPIMHAGREFHVTGRAPARPS